MRSERSRDAKMQRMDYICSAQAITPEITLLPGRANGNRFDEDLSAIRRLEHHPRTRAEMTAWRSLPKRPATPPVQ
jgi:hypothetical protein